MILFPAVDIKDGKCVRLKQGLANEVTVFSADPVSQAKAWEDAGGRFLHIVDLDGAFSGKPKNYGLIQSICKELSIPVQLGGGIRDKQIAGAYLDAGVSRLIIGTMALEEPDKFADLCSAFPGKIGISLDADGGRLKTKGWVEDSGKTVSEVLPGLQAEGAAFVVYTDISRDGMQSGVNLEAMSSLCELSDIPVLAAGGVATLDDVKALQPLGSKGLEGIISGRAIYEGTLDLKQAQDWLDANK